MPLQRILLDEKWTFFHLVLPALAARASLLISLAKSKRNLLAFTNGREKARPWSPLGLSSERVR
jgi:hypothetical protein